MQPTDQPTPPVEPIDLDAIKAREAARNADSYSARVAIYDGNPWAFPRSGEPSRSDDIDALIRAVESRDAEIGRLREIVAKQEGRGK